MSALLNVFTVHFTYKCDFVILPLPKIGTVLSMQTLTQKFAELTAPIFANNWHWILLKIANKEVIYLKNITTNYKIKKIANKSKKPKL